MRPNFAGIAGSELQGQILLLNFVEKRLQYNESSKVEFLLKQVILNPHSVLDSA
tara:strand:+ start:462 stop:623 length:162 start_codon:yes stop_codon:yes gene_type:complete